MRFLLDTNIISDLVRNPNGRTTSKIRIAGEQNVCTSIIVSAELRYGAAKKQSPKLTKQLEAILGVIEILPFDEPCDAVYGILRAELEQTGNLIGGNDLLIASQAVAHDLTLVTDNEQEFSRVKQLRIENWLRY